MTRARILPPAALLAVALAPALAAADTTPLSAFPDRPARYAQAAGPVPVTVKPSGSSHDVTVTGSVCLAVDPPAYWIDGDAAIPGRYAELQVEDGFRFGIERIATRGDVVELERITASILHGELVPSARSRIPLREVARLDGLVVYAYRWGAKIFFLARSAGMAVIRRDGALGLEQAPECGVVYTELRVRDSGASQVAQIRGTVPGTGRPFLVDASVAQTGRDPEPLLAVSARLGGR